MSFTLTNYERSMNKLSLAALPWLDPNPDADADDIRNMRGILVDCLVQLHISLELPKETLYTTISILDRFLEIQPAETIAILAASTLKICDRLCKGQHQQVLAVEKRMLARLHAPAPCFFLPRNIKSTSTPQTIQTSSINKLSLPWHNPVDLRPPPPALFKRRESKVDDYMHLQPKFNSNRRANLVDWMQRLHYYLFLADGTLYVAVSILDRFLEVETQSVARNEFEYVALAALFIASKYEQVQDSFAPPIDFFLDVGNSYCKRNTNIYQKQLLAMEKRIFARLEWKIHLPTPYTYLPWYIKAAENPTDTTMENMVYLYAELSMLFYDEVRMYNPSMVAAAAVYAARVTLNKSDIWHETLEKHTGFTEMQVMECAKMMVGFHSAAFIKGSLVYSKYSYDDLGGVVLYPPAKSLLAIAAADASTELGI